MINDRSNNDLREIVNQRINALILEMEDAEWGAERVIDTINDLIAEESLPKFGALDEARQSTPKNFVSDGNEG